MLKKCVMKSGLGRTLWLVAAVVCWMTPHARSQASSYVPPIVASATSVVAATGLVGDEANVALDACGNIYTIQQFGGTVQEIPAGGGAATTVVAAGGDNYRITSLWIDAAKSNLFYTQGDAGVHQIPIAKCVPQTAATTNISIGNFGAVSWYWNASAVATDSADNLFIATNVACCAPANELLQQYAAGGYTTGTVLLASLSDPITSIAVDPGGNIYYASGGGLYELPVTTPAVSASPAVYSTAAVSIGHYANVVGVSFDGLGNLYISEQGASTLFEIPNESTGNGEALNLADQFIVATGVSVANGVAIAPGGQIFLTDNGSSVNEMTLSSASFGSVATGSSGQTTVNVAFNATVTPAAFNLVSPGGVFSSTGGTCAAQSYTQGQSCTVNIGFTPAAPGASAAGLVIADASGTALATTYLSGVGTAAAITMDPGVVSSIGTGYSSPQSVAVDNSGNVFVVDSAAGSVWEVATGATNATSIGSGLKSPQSVAVDGAGNVLVADSGNNRLVEIPLVNGTPSTSSQNVLFSSTTSLAGASLNAPEGIAIDAQGNLYVADTGNQRVLYIPYIGAWESDLAQVIGSNMKAPSAVALDTAGDVFVSDASTGSVYELMAPLSAGLQVTVATGLSDPTSIAVDASGALFVVDQGAYQVLRIPNISGMLKSTEAVNVTGQLDANGHPLVAAPFGVNLDSNGNVYVTDKLNAKVYSVSRTVVTQDAGKNAPGSVSNAMVFAAENSGNATLTFGTPYATLSGSTSQFSLLSSESNACADGASIPTGQSCSVEAAFTPNAQGAFTLNVALNSNAANGTNHTAVFAGTGWPTIATTTNIAQTSPTGALTYDEAVTFSVTVSSAQGTPLGVVSLVVDSVTKQTANLAAGAASFTLPAGALAGGSHTIGAVYKGGDSGTVTFSGSSGSLSIAVAAVPTTTALSYTPTYTSPASQASGTPLTLTVMVASGYAGTPTGVVTFNVTDSGGNSTSGTGALAPVTGGYQATYSYNPVAPATAAAYDVVTFTATYSGDSNFASSKSATSGNLYVTAPQGAALVTASSASLTSGVSNSSSSVTFTATTYGGWTGVIGFSCDPSTLPANARCVFSPGQMSVTPSTPSSIIPAPTVQLSVAIDQPPQTPTMNSAMLWWIAAPAGLLLLSVRRRMKAVLVASRLNLLPLLLAVVAFSAGIAGVTGCSNSNMQLATPKGTTAVTVFASADPFVTGKTDTTQACGVNSKTNQGDPTLSPCSQQSFKVNVTVQ